MASEFSLNVEEQCSNNTLKPTQGTLAAVKRHYEITAVTDLL